MERIVIRRHLMGNKAAPTTTDPADELQLEKVGGYGYIDAHSDTLDEDLSQIHEEYTGEVVVPITNSPNTPFILGVFDQTTAQVLKKGQWKITLKGRNGKRYLIRAEYPGSSTFVIERISDR